MQRNNQTKALYWHKKNLTSYYESQQNGVREDLSSADLTIPVTYSQKDGFQVKLSSSPFDWFLAEQIAAKETELGSLDDKLRLQLALGYFPL